MKQLVFATLACLCIALCAPLKAGQSDSRSYPSWDTFSDTWSATDALGRRLPSFKEVGPVRSDRFVGLFYFLWLGAHVNGGPYDISKIKMTNPPAWGPLYAPHHWGESVFGYYLTEDPYVLRKHAQMLADAGVDVIIFDVTNQITYRNNYMELLRVFDEVRKSGGRTPQVAFLCPFWDPAKVVNELWRDLYQPGKFRHLWFLWEGKPLILADRAKLDEVEQGGSGHVAVALERGHTLGQTFTTTRPFSSAGVRLATWHETNSSVTLSIFQGGPGGKQLASTRLKRVFDNEWAYIRLKNALSPGIYHLELSDPAGKVAWWSMDKEKNGSLGACADGKPTSGTRSWQTIVVSGTQNEMLQFFTFRKPQPDYFQGPTQPDMWSWLEVYPQHVFRNSRGEKEQMSVGVAQNAVGNRLGSMSEPGARGRSFHNNKVGLSAEDVLYGYNFAEQFERALKADPKFIFITGWNEWIAGRHPEFCGVKGDALFPDEYDQENSRDIEPMTGGHGDNYYYQMAAYIRRYKGVRVQPSPGRPRTIGIERGFEQWKNVLPEFRDDRLDTVHRDFSGFNHCAQYVNQSGRNDFVCLKVAHDQHNLYFYAQTQEPISAAGTSGCMMLFIDIDCDHRTGWEGYDFVINRTPGTANKGRLERNAGGWNWKQVGDVTLSCDAHQFHVAVSRKALELRARDARIEFKWADNVPLSGNILDFISDGDVAPNGRFNYRYEFGKPATLATPHAAE